jgi:hypothetical protein
MYSSGYKCSMMVSKRGCLGYPDRSSAKKDDIMSTWVSNFVGHGCMTFGYAWPSNTREQTRCSRGLAP